MRTRIEGDLPAFYRAEIEKGKVATTRAIHGAGDDLKKRWRAQIRGAGLGDRLANTIRGEAYPKGAVSFRPAATVYAKAPHIVSAHADGATIRSKDGFWLAIPLPAAGKAAGGRRMTPLQWERQNGAPLRFVYRQGRSALLVADDARLRTGRRLGGTAARKGGRRRRDGILTGAQTIPVFVLVPQVRLQKRFDLDRETEMVTATLAQRIVTGWR